MATGPSGGSGGYHKAFPEFTHIHCSSRFDRPADVLENDINDWMANSQLLTMTEVQNNSRSSRLREKGWTYYNAKSDASDRDNCAIAWEKKLWKQGSSRVLKLTDHPYERAYSHTHANVWAATVVLTRTDTGHRLLVSVSHMPAHVEDTHGTGHWRTTTDQWQARKTAYLHGLSNWSTHVADMERKHKTDATLIVADWNLNLKETWVRQLLNDRWPKSYFLAWTHFPTSGGSLVGGPVAPSGAPGHSTGDRIIDGSLVRALKVTKEPFLMPRVQSSDHRPYTENFRFTDPAETNTPGDPTGDTKHGEEWWGFGDYGDDEIYEITRVLA